MPNWCENVVTFKHENPAMLEKLVAAYNANQLMETFFPCPKELRDTMAGSHPKGSPEQAELEKTEKENEDRYGYKNWKDWCTNEWGTKWDVGRDKSGQIELKPGATEVEVNFDSAWAPPVGFYEKMTDELGFEITALYCELGVGFCGIWEDGVDTTYNINTPKAGESWAKWLDKHIPAKLIVQFNLFEQMKEFEENV